MKPVTPEELKNNNILGTTNTGIEVAMSQCSIGGQEPLERSDRIKRRLSEAGGQDQSDDTSSLQCGEVVNTKRLRIINPDDLENNNLVSECVPKAPR
jgi:hypothetical protein